MRTILAQCLGAGVGPEQDLDVVFSFERGWSKKAAPCRECINAGQTALVNSVSFEPSGEVKVDVECQWLSDVP
eukprot:CAMPEP_0118877268 /NCGR_PEP_ID=MMETSP1163-20130328/17626_1 /TAXON_ID=124430 /ORGANISM="Phaeomonas parva, Strain CCMP2877" /LENGTH=72 /DNA_ID=CAMNT_0006812961 /DNA_START=205 /DNA_END=420 /DNA_ORIENTATION=+